MTDLDSLIIHLSRTRERISALINKITPKISPNSISNPKEKVNLYKRLSNISSKALDQQQSIAVGEEK